MNPNNNNNRGRFGPGGGGSSTPTVYQYFVAKELESLAATPPVPTNFSLVLDKYVGASNTGKNTNQLDLGKKWLKEKFVPLYTSGQKNIGLIKGLESYRQRWEAMLQSHGAATGEAKTVWRLAMHQGRASVVENGTILLHHTLGFPYLPGQSLKGLARTYAESQQLAPDHIDFLFGFQRKAEASEGALVFYDAIPTYWPTLKIDILTPHFGDWYGGKNRGTLPTDNNRLNPIYFLTVAPGATFKFGVGPVARLRPDPQAGQWAAEGLKLLLEGLYELGAGAKTAAGYGQFEAV